MVMVCSQLNNSRYAKVHEPVMEEHADHPALAMLHAVQQFIRGQQQNNAYSLVRKTFRREGTFTDNQSTSCR